MRTSTRSGYDDAARRSRTQSGRYGRQGTRKRLRATQEFNEVGSLLPGEIQLELAILVIDHRPQIGRTSIVKIRRMLPEFS
jgi:hypothetical protein